MSGNYPLTCRAALVGLWAAVLALGGCSNGVHWEGPTYQDARALAVRSNRPVFVYFRSWYSVECTNFEENVLKDPAVLAETTALVCVPLDFDWDRPLAQQWGLRAVPAFVIVAPDGTILAQGQAPLTRDQVLAAFHAARTAHASSAPPAATVTTRPAGS